MNRRSWTDRLVGVSIALLLFGLGLRYAATAVLQALPVLVGLCLCGGLGAFVFARYRNRDYW